jgi:hypothetical protein
MRPRTLLCLAAIAAATAPACANSDSQRTLPPSVVGMQGTAPPIADDGQVQIYQVSSPIQLPVRRPNDGERPSGNVDPYPRAPFQLSSDTRITIRFTLSNLDDKEHTVELLLDPWNEFVRYLPGLQVSNETTTPNLSGIDKFFVLPPLARVEGIITPDDMVELAVDLGTAMVLNKRPPAADSAFAGPGLYNRAFNVQNRSSQPDPVLQPFYPSAVAGIVGFDLGLRTYELAKVAVEVLIDVEDVQGDRVIKEGDTTTRAVGRPGTVLSPPPPVVMN